MTPRTPPDAADAEIARRRAGSAPWAPRLAARLAGLPVLLLALGAWSLLPEIAVINPNMAARRAQPRAFEGLMLHEVMLADSSLLFDRAGRLEISPLPRRPWRRYRLDATLRQGIALIFHLYFARSGETYHYFQFTQEHDAYSGFYSETAGKVTRWAGLKSLAPALRAPRIKLELLLERDAVTLGLNGHSQRMRWPVELGQPAFRIEPRNAGNMADLLLDHISLRQEVSPAEEHAVVDHCFGGPLFLGDLGHALGLAPRGSPLRLVGAVLLLLLALGFDLLVAAARGYAGSLRPGRLAGGLERAPGAGPPGAWTEPGGGTLTPEGLALLLLPAQAALLIAARSSLRLPFASLLLCLVVLFVARYLQVSRRGLCHQVTGRTSSGRMVVLSLLGIGVHLGALVPVLAGFAGAGLELQICTAMLALLPLLSHAGMMALSRHPPAGALLLVAAQHPLAFVLAAGHGTRPLMALLCLPAAALAVAALVQVLKQPALGRPATYICCGLLVLGLLGLIEVELRTIPLDRQLLTLEALHQSDLSHIDLDEALAAHVQRSAPREVGIGRRRYPARPAPGVQRIVCLGSSSTYGDGASDPERSSYPAMLQQVLRERTSRPVEVINGGIPGATFYQLKVLLERSLVQLKPSLVLLYFGTNKDLLAARRHHARVEQALREAPFVRTREELWVVLQLRYHPRWLVRAFLGMGRSSLFVAAVRATLWLKGIWIPGGPAGEEGPIVDPRTPREVVEICMRHGIELLLMPEVGRDAVLARGRVGSGGMESRSEYFPIFKALAARHAGSGIHFGDLLGSFRREHVHRFFLDQVHMNDDGYLFLARAIADMMAQKGLVR